MLRVVLILLLGALGLEIVLATQWTEPFREPGTWVLIGVSTGVALRGLGRALTRRERKGEDLLRRVSLGIWVGTALGGLISLFF